MSCDTQLAWDQAVVQENAGIQKLKKALKKERRAHEEDEGRLAALEDARLKVEQKEERDSRKAVRMHLLLGLRSSRGQWY